MSDWIDYSQNRKIRELEESLGSAHYQMATERRRMRSELSRVQGTLEQRLDRVSASLDAFIELSDVRAVLAMFDGAALARHRTLQMLDGVPVAHPDLEDVPDYWLVPAALGLHALLEDDPAAARVRFDEAARRDATRAGHFAALATALTSADHARAMNAAATADLLPQLPLPTEEVTRGQRALWLLTADGSFGDDARQLLLSSTLRAWSEEQVEVPASAGLSALTADASGASPSPASRGSRGKKAGGLVERAEAARRITALREGVARVVALDGEDASTAALAPDEVSAAFLSDTLRLLVEEGSPEEAPLLARARELRAVIESSGEGGPPQRWTDTVGTVASLLGDDLVRQDAPPHRRTFALALQRPTVMERAEELVREAAAPVEDSTTLQVQGVQVTLSSHGAEPRELERARTQLRARWHDTGSARTYAWGLLAMAGLLAVLGMVSANGLVWFLCVATAVGAGIALMVDQTRRAEARDTAEATVRRLDAHIAEAAEKWRDSLLASEEHAVTARHEAGQIDRLLNT
ncbi:hypothetical protein [Nocardiopsis alborubida]|uniref:Uncharacterized protein n=1 Tax=Nocardiopsis alborubida TaxID=146802 RepID=A0A7X6MJF5_9ACTN|nr:hypothetical protein [Nocardiopsis alborubida]NKZ00576.1 hypothetical protein [Nocardiopsis alborubida]